MAKVNVKKFSDDQLVERTSLLEGELDKAWRAYELAQTKFHNQRDLLREVQLEMEDRLPKNLATMLTTRISSGENVVGYHWLRDRTWKGDWKGTGFGHFLGHWKHTNQYCLGVRIPDRDFTDSQMAALEVIITDVMPLVKAGACSSGTLKLMSKGSSVDLATLKILDIQDAGLCEYANWQLGLMPSGEWVIFDSYVTKYSFGRARLTGTLAECLREIRTHLNASNRDEEEEEDDD